jgi:uroporphyrin-3 C-methyltransferase
VREAIAGELLALRSVRLPDTEGIVFSLGRLAGRVDALPLRADLPAGLHGDTAVEPEPEPGLERLWFSIKRTLLGLVRVERRDDPVPAALSAAERVLVRQQLAVELELARIAVLRGQRDAFQSSLDGALAILERSFSADSGDVDGAAILLREMRGLAIDPPRPEISGSLNLLRGQTTGAR